MSWNSTRALLASSAGALALAAGLWFVLRGSSEPRSAHAAGPLEDSVVAASPEIEFARAPAGGEVRLSMHGLRLDGSKSVSIDALPGDSFVPLPCCSVTGVVVDTRGQPIKQADVQLSRFRVCTDSSGSFTLQVVMATSSNLSADAPLLARAPGHSPALIEHFGARVLAAPEGALSEKLVLGEGFAITGHFVDEQGRRASRGRVRIVDATPLGAGSEGEFLEPTTRMLDATGGFELDSLLPRSYVLECELHQPFVVFRTTPIAAGSHDVEIHIPSDALIERVRGFLLTSDGASLADARLDLAFQFEDRVWWPKRSQIGAGPRAVTSPGGAFELSDVPSANAWVVVEHPLVPAQALSLAGLDLRSEITLVAKRRARLQLDRFDRDLPGVTIDMLDANGVAASWEPTTDTSSSLSGAVIALDRGRSNPLTTLEGHFTLVVRSGGAELLHREIDLAAEQTTRIGP